MRLVVSPLLAGSVRLDGVVVSTQQQPYLAVLHPGIPRSEHRVLLCTWCKRIHIPPGDWVEIEDGLVRLKLFTEPRPPTVEHRACPECRSIISRLIGDPSAA